MAGTADGKLLPSENIKPAPRVKIEPAADSLAPDAGAHGAALRRTEIASEGQMSLLYRIMGDKDTSTGSNVHQFGHNGKDVAEAPRVLSTVVWRLGVPRLTMKRALDHLTLDCGIVPGREIDFFYCPGDFNQPYIKGYAILNFRDLKKAEELVKSVPECSWAQVQGLALNTSNFLKRRYGRIRNSRFRPLVWPSADVTIPSCLWDPNGHRGNSGPVFERARTSHL